MVAHIVKKLFAFYARHWRIWGAGALRHVPTVVLFIDLKLFLAYFTKM
jgi:hypothetical protein